MKLPIKVTLDFFERVDDTWYYETVLMVPGSDASMVVALVQTDLDGNASVVQTKRDGFDALDDRQRDELLVRLFRLAWREMITDDGSAIEWWISDVSRFLITQFGGADAAVLRYALNPFVDPSHAVKDMVIIRID